MYPFREGSFAVRNGWYVAGFAQELKENPIARTILGQPVALYRKSDGEAVAVDGRCPHRNFPLGEGKVCGDSIVCGYHGIAFGPDGQCTSLPVQEHIPRSYRIRTYPLVEHGLWLWIWPGDADKADTGLLPDLAAIGYDEEGMEPLVLAQHEVKCRYQLLNDNLLDLSHIAFLHAGNIGTLENATEAEERETGDRMISSMRRTRGTKPSPAMKKRRGLTGLEDHVVGMAFYAPGFHAGIGDHFYSHDDPERDGQVIERNRIFHAVTPATHNTSLYFVAGASHDPDFALNAKERVKPTLEEDIFASEEIEKMIELVGGNPSELMIRTDQTAVMGRRMLQRLMDEEAALDATQTA